MTRLARSMIPPAATGALVLVAAGFGGEYSWVLDGIGAFRLHLAIGAGLVVVAAVMVRLWGAAAIGLAAAVLAVAGLGPVLREAVSDAPAKGPEFRLVYANLYEKNAEIGAAVDALLAADADVLVTSETTAPAADLLRAAYPYRLVREDGPMRLRTAIWSRLPLDRGRLYLDNTVAPTAAAALVTLAPGAQVHLTGVHFSRAIEGLRRVQSEALADMTGGMAVPRIVIGDFNAAPWSWTLSHAAEVTGTRLLGGHRVTWSGNYPTPAGAMPEIWGQQIDTMLSSDRILVRAVEALTLPGSDHRALRLRLQLRQD